MTLLDIVGPIATILSLIITSVVSTKIANKKNQVRLVELSQKSTYLDHDQIQEDLKNSRAENRELTARIERMNNRLDRAFTQMQLGREYTDVLRRQLIEHNIVPDTWER
jgi:uncharacterized protein YlxW (UPF0749 family)